MPFTIKHRWKTEPVYTSETADTERSAVLEAVAKGADLQGAYLKGADLQGAYLKGADLQGADLQGAYLKGADLQGAYLKGAYLKGADLQGAYLKGAYLKGAYLKGADLQGAYLKGADLQGAYLKGAYLKGADLKGADLQGADLQGALLDPIKHDFFAILLCAPNEIAGLRLALVEGRVNGSVYAGDCACLLGTIGNIRGCSYDALVNIEPDSSRPAERFFLAIQPGDTPDKSQPAQIAIEWIDEFTSRIAAFHAA